MIAVSLSPEFLKSSEFREMRKDAVCLYLYVRATASLVGEKLLCRETIAELTEVCGFIEMTTRKCIEELARRGWIKKDGEFFQVGTGTVFFVDDLVAGRTKQTWRSTNIADLIKKAQTEPPKPPPSQEASKDFFVKPELIKNRKTTPGDLAIYFAKRYNDTFGEKYMISKGKDLGIMKVLMDHCEDAEKVERAIRWLFDNWEDVSTKTFVTGRPSIGLLGSSGFWNQLQGWMKDGIKERKKGASGLDEIKKRFDQKQMDKEAGNGW